MSECQISKSKCLNMKRDALEAFALKCGVPNPKSYKNKGQICSQLLEAQSIPAQTPTVNAVHQQAVTATASGLCPPEGTDLNSLKVPELSKCAKSLGISLTFQKKKRTKKQLIEAIENKRGSSSTAFVQAPAQDVEITVVEQEEVSAPETEDLKSLTVPMLKTRAQSLGIKTYLNSQKRQMKKAELIEAIKGKSETVIIPQQEEVQESIIEEEVLPSIPEQEEEETDPLETYLFDLMSNKESLRSDFEKFSAIKSTDLTSEEMFSTIETYLYTILGLKGTSTFFDIPDTKGKEHFVISIYKLPFSELRKRLLSKGHSLQEVDAYVKELSQSKDRVLEKLISSWGNESPGLEDVLEDIETSSMPELEPESPSYNPQTPPYSPLPAPELDSQEEDTSSFMFEEGVNPPQFVPEVVEPEDVSQYLVEEQVSQEPSVAPWEKSSPAIENTILKCLGLLS